MNQRRITILFAFLLCMLLTACPGRVRENGPTEKERATARQIAQSVMIFADRNEGRLPTSEEVRSHFGRQFHFDFDATTYMPSGNENIADLPETYIVAVVPSKTGAWVSRIDSSTWRIPRRN